MAAFLLKFLPNYSNVRLLKMHVHLLKWSSYSNVRLLKRRVTQMSGYSIDRTQMSGSQMSTYSIVLLPEKRQLNDLRMKKKSRICLAPK